MAGVEAAGRPPKSVRNRCLLGALAALLLWTAWGCQWTASSGIASRGAGSRDVATSSASREWFYDDSFAKDLPKDFFQHYDMESFYSRGKLYPANTHGGSMSAESRERWAQETAKKLAMPKAKEWQGMDPGQLRDTLPIRVISLARATQRRQSIIANLQEAGLKFELVNAIDGAATTSAYDSVVAKYIQGIRLELWKRHQPHHRKKVALDVSHYIQLQRILDEDRPALLFEDDARVPTSLPNTQWDNNTSASRWYGALLSALQELPEDWDVLYLDMCFETVGATIRGRLQIVKDGACAIGYLATPKFARAVITNLQRTAKLGRGPANDGLYQSADHARAWAVKCVDGRREHTGTGLTRAAATHAYAAMSAVVHAADLTELFKHWEISAYITQPRLITDAQLPSEVGYDPKTRSVNLTEEELMWATLHEGTGAGFGLKKLPHLDPGGRRRRLWR